MNWHDAVGPALILVGIAALAIIMVWLMGRNLSVCICNESDDCTCGGAWGEKR